MRGRVALVRRPGMDAATVTILSIDEHRVVQALERWALLYDAGAARNPFGLDRVRAKLCRKIAQAINEGKHR